MMIDDLGKFKPLGWWWNGKFNKFEDIADDDPDWLEFLSHIVDDDETQAQ